MENGMNPREAAQKAVYDFSEKLKQKRGKAGAMSLVCLNNKGEWGVGTNVEFSFVVAEQDSIPKVFVAHPEHGAVVYEEASVLLSPITTTIDINGQAHVVSRVITVGGWYCTNGILVAIITALAVTEIFSGQYSQNQENSKKLRPYKHYGRRRFKL
ncbi:MAG: hypothetical protein PWQ97_881 [Tepidanaerobacteraceae bacterium]|nr:hypothetical protein [Tepidanaerobacteraceae bacterium]